MLHNTKIIELQNVSISNGDITVFEGLNFELVEAEFCYVVGKSGSGKSSLLKSLYGELPITGGKAQTLGTDLRSLSIKDIPFLRRKIGMVFQDFQLFHRWSVKENLNFVLKATDWKSETERHQRINEVLEAVDLTHKINQQVFTLSGGEQQRLAIARAILNKPQLLIADEPTGNLDPESSDNILYLIADLASRNKMAVLFATHDQRILQKFPARVFRCEQGQLIEID
ncbi:MAG: ATP-binding cassette domain-containing protein [Saprospiraceae bacterium]|nr:ATP-binding cassette domain-containing protein [Saprospiraceae bacterium]